MHPFPVNTCLLLLSSPPLSSISSFGRFLSGEGRILEQHALKENPENDNRWGDYFQSLSPDHHDDQLLRTWNYIWNAGKDFIWNDTQVWPGDQLKEFVFLFYGNPQVKGIL